MTKQQNSTPPEPLLASTSPAARRRDGYAQMPGVFLLFLLLAAGVAHADWSLMDQLPWASSYEQPPAVDEAWFERCPRPFLVVFTENYLQWPPYGVHGRPVYNTVRGVRHTTIIPMRYGDFGLEPWDVGDCNYDGQVNIKDLGVYAEFYS